MASELYVETLKGLTSGANANKVIIPSGQTLDASAGGFTTPAGHVIQVVQARTTTQVATTSSSYADTGFSASITPSSTSSKILIIGTATLRAGTGGNNYQHTIYRNGTTNLAPTATRGLIQFRDAGNEQSDGTFTAMYLDSPSTTSSTTYNWYHKSEGSVTCTFVVDGSYAQLTLMEIAG